MDRADLLHQEQLLSHRMMMLCVAVVAALALLQNIFLGVGLIWFLPPVLFAAALLMVHLWCQNVRPYWLSFSALAGLWGTMTCYGWATSGLGSPVLFGWPLVVVGATILLGRIQGLVVMGLSGLAAVLMIWLPDLQAVTYHSGLVLALYTVIYFLMAMSILDMYRRSVQQIRAQQVQHLKIQQAMEISEARNQAILDALPDVVFRVTRDSTIQDVNIGEQARWPLRVATLLGQKVTHFLQAGDTVKLQEALSWTLSGDGMQTQELHVEHAELGRRTVESRMVAVDQEHAILFWRDITERKRIELDRLTRLHRMEGMDRFTLFLSNPEVDGDTLLQAVADHAAQILQARCSIDLTTTDGQAFPPFFSQVADAQQTGEQTTDQTEQLEIPLVLHGHRQGTVKVWRDGPTGAFSTEEQSTLQTLVDRAGLTLTNRELDQRNRVQAEELRLANEELEARIRKRTQELARANERLQELTIRDGLTGIFNRRHFDERLEQEIRRLQRSDQPLGLLLCDIDFFKRYNDHYGHPEGDQCLKKVAQVLQNTFRRAGDVVARYGGEEFAVILPNTSLEQLMQLADRLKEQLTSLALPHLTSEVASVVTLSVGGVGVTRFDQVTAEGMVQAADQALYCSKHSGRNRATLRSYIFESTSVGS